MKPTFTYGRARLYRADCIDWLHQRRPNSIHACLTDPPYGLVEYSRKEQHKLRNGNGGVWRLPPKLEDGYDRIPLPRFTILSKRQVEDIDEFFHQWARALIRVLVPGAHVLVATNPLVSFVVSDALYRAGLQRRGEVVRLVQTMRGGDRPKDAHRKFATVSVIPRSMWEPWLLFRKPLDGRVRDNLNKWGTGALRRPSRDQPFGDVIRSSPTPTAERRLAPHPSLKPQAFLRQAVRAMLPVGKGVVLDTFAGSGSTLAAAEAVGLRSIGVETLSFYCTVAKRAIPKLAALEISGAKPNGIRPTRS
jgi:site-specific DNA-methyltransferase (adenine-specific)